MSKDVCFLSFVRLTCHVWSLESFKIALTKGEFDE